MIKAYIKYRVAQCSACYNQGNGCPIDFYGYGGMAGDIARDNCESYEPENAGPGVKSDYCQHRQIIEHVEYKEAKRFEIVKDIDSGYVSIGKDSHELKDVDTVKVDYGNGWVLEWGEDDNAE